MSSYIRLIDEGLRGLIFTKFRDVMGFSDLTQDSALVPKNIAFRKISESRQQSKIYTEFFNVWRSSIKFSSERHAPGMSLYGSYPFYVNDATKTDVVNVRAVAVDLSYDVYFWSKDLSKLMDVSDLYMFWMYTDPVLRLNYDSKAPLEFKLTFGDISDDSPIDHAYEKGVYFVYKMPINVEGFVFKENIAKTIKKIVISFYDDIVPPVLIDQQIIQ